jgi:hypothetical protein
MCTQSKYQQYNLVKDSKRKHSAYDCKRLIQGKSIPPISHAEFSHLSNPVSQIYCDLFLVPLVIYLLMAELVMPIYWSISYSQTLPSSNAKKKRVTIQQQ